MFEPSEFEEPARWRTEAPDPAPPPARWDLPIEPYMEIDEAYPGEVALRDLGSGTPSAGGSERIIGRFAAIRFLRITTWRPHTLAWLKWERSLASRYTNALRAPPEEAKALRAIVALARWSPPRRIMSFLDEAAIVAARSKHHWGSFALRREAYLLAMSRGWHAEAAVAAQGISGLAESAGAPRSAKLWRRRARVLARRAAAA